MSKIEIINRGLLKLGEPPVSSLNDAAFGRSYEIIYEDARKLLLSSYPWRFAATLKRLPRQEKKYGERFVYPLPADCLLLLKVFGAEAPEVTYVRPQALSGYELVGNAVVTPLEQGICIEYVRAVEDDALFPPLFREALAARIAAELSMRLKHAPAYKQMFDNEFYNFIRQAELNNEIAKSAEQLPDSSWILVREQWHC